MDSNVTILVVDDEEDICDISEFMLTKAGHKVLTANSGNQALKVLSEHQDIKLILSDVRMPDGDGVFLLKNRPQHIPIVFISGFAEISHEEAIRQGASFLLTKPIIYEELIKFIEEFIK